MALRALRLVLTVYATRSSLGYTREPLAQLGGAPEGDYFVGIVGHRPISGFSVHTVVVLFEEPFEELQFLD